MKDGKGFSHPRNRIPSSFFDRNIFYMLLGVAAIVLASCVFYFIDFVPSLSHLDITMFSGPTTGNYYSTVQRATEIASQKRGRIVNVVTNGSLDNITRISAMKGGAFALAQNGMPWPAGMELIAHIKSPETVFFLGPRADSINSLAHLRGKRIGIGPKGSGTAYLAERIFSGPGMKDLNVVLSHHTADEQLDLLRRGVLDLGVFVISDRSSFIENAVRDAGMQIAGLKQCESIAMRLPFLRPEFIREGLYDPVRNLPPSDRKVLRMDTLIISNGRAHRSDVIGVLSVFSGIYPNLINYNRSISNYTGMEMSPASQDFFNNHGPEALDRYAPRLMNLVPLGSLVQLAMAVSIFFNLMGVANRFLLWRIDANRVAIETAIRELFGSDCLPDEIERLPAGAAHDMTALDSVIASLDALRSRCRRQSQSMLVPMGAEMAYRYQEEIISRNLAALKSYRARHS